MWPYPWTHVGTPSHLGHMDRVAATMPSQAHAGAAQEAPDIGQWEGQDVPLVRPSSCNVKGGIPSSRRYLPTYLRAASESQEDPVHGRAEQEAPRLTTEALAARGDSLQHPRRRVAASISRSVCPASSSTATPAGGPEEQGEFRRRINEYILHEEYYKSVIGEDGEEPLDALGTPPYKDMGSYPYSGPPTDLADTVSLPRQPSRPVWSPELLITSRSPEVRPAYVKDPHLPEPTYGDLDRTAELLAKLLSGSEDPDVTALSEAVKAKLGITEPLPRPALAHLIRTEHAG